MEGQALQARRNPWLAVLAAGVIALALWKLQAERAGIGISTLDVQGIPVTIYRPASGAPAPLVLIAHGFAGSQQLMQSFALSFARNGYMAVTFDFPGHGRNATPLTGSITDANGATRTLLDSMRRVAAAVRPLGDGRFAVLGHSMASDIVIRYAQQTPDVAATIAVSMFSPVVTAVSPRNLLIIVGDWEPMLKREALRAVGLAVQPRSAAPGVTYGDFAAGTARRATFSAHVEHATVLFSQDSTREAIGWLDQVFGIRRSTPPRLDASGPWILLLVAGIVALARPLSSLLPRVTPTPVGAGLPWRRLALPLLLPMIATPLLLRVLPTHFLPVLVGDYLAAHFALYGLLTAACLRTVRGPGWLAGIRPASLASFALATLLVIAYGFIGLVWPINRFVTSFVPGPERLLLVLALLVGTLCFFLSVEWLTRGVAAARGGYATAKFAFLCSLGLAVALNFERLFFLIIIVPVIMLFFLIYGLFSRWVYLRTGSPLVAGIANAVAFAWAIGVTFPLLAGK